HEKTSLQAPSPVVAVAAAHLCQVADVHGMLKWRPADRRARNRPLLLRKHGVAGIAILGHHLAFGANMLPVMAAEAAGKVEVANVVGVRLPVKLHFREGRAAVDALDFFYCVADLQLL